MGKSIKGRGWKSYGVRERPKGDWRERKVRKRGHGIYKEGQMEGEIERHKKWRITITRHGWKRERGAEGKRVKEYTWKIQLKETGKSKRNVE